MTCVCGHHKFKGVSIVWRAGGGGVGILIIELGYSEPNSELNLLGLLYHNTIVGGL